MEPVAAPRGLAVWEPPRDRSAEPALQWSGTYGTESSPGFKNSGSRGASGAGAVFAYAFGPRIHGASAASTSRTRPERSCSSRKMPAQVTELAAILLGCENTRSVSKKSVVPTFRSEIAKSRRSAALLRGLATLNEISSGPELRRTATGAAAALTANRSTLLKTRAFILAVRDDMGIDQRPTRYRS